MSIVLQGFDSSLARIQGALTMNVVLAIVCCTAVVAGLLFLAVRRLRPARLDERRPVDRQVLISWRDRVGLRQSEDGLCKDISAGGMGLDLPFPFKVGARLSLRVVEGKLSYGAVVRRCRRNGPRYAVGVQFDTRMCAPGQVI